MAVKKFVVGNFKEEHDLFHAVSEIQKKSKKIYDVFTPYPIHGLDIALKQRETKLHTAGFVYGALGTITAVTGMGWIFTKDWPNNFGGKPFWSFPAFIPITFELTVLFAAVGMVLTFCWLCQIAPFVKKHRFSLRATDDALVLVMEVTKENGTEDTISKLLEANGAQDINIQDAKEGWWFGLYNKD